MLYLLLWFGLNWSCFCHLLSILILFYFPPDLYWLCEFYLFLIRLVRRKNRLVLRNAIVSLSLDNLANQVLFNKGFLSGQQIGNDDMASSGVQKKQLSGPS